MKVIHKITLAVADSQIVTLPYNSKILSVQAQHGQPVLWYMHSGAKQTRDRTILTVGTGHEVPDDLLGRHIGTYQLQDGAFVGHVFEKAQPAN